MCHVQLTTLQADWSLRHAPPLISPEHAHKGYLGGIFASALTNGKKRTHTWSSEIPSALAWVRLAMQSGYSRADDEGNASGDTQGIR